MPGKGKEEGKRAKRRKGRERKGREEGRGRGGRRGEEGEGGIRDGGQGSRGEGGKKGERVEEREGSRTEVYQRAEHASYRDECKDYKCGHHHNGCYVAILHSSSCKYLSTVVQHLHPHHKRGKPFHYTHIITATLHTYTHNPTELLGEVKSNANEKWSS